MKKLNKEKKQELLYEIQSLKDEYPDPSIRRTMLKLLLNKYIGYDLTPQPLQQAFLIIAPPDEDGFSEEVSMDELKSYHPSFNTTNGSTWSRTDSSSSFAKTYKINNIKQGGRINSIKLDGFNLSFRIDRRIRNDIVRTIQRKPCAILDVSNQIEVDHKNGKHDDLHMISIESQTLADFQPLSKAANDAKRNHCCVCQKTHKRYDAKKLGYKESFTKGDFDTDNCQGCYWYDPIAFNREISKDFIKTR